MAQLSKRPLGELTCRWLADREGGDGGDAKVLKVDKFPRQADAWLVSRPGSLLQFRGAIFDYRTVRFGSVEGLRGAGPRRWMRVFDNPAVAKGRDIPCCWDGFWRIRLSESTLN